MDKYAELFRAAGPYMRVRKNDIHIPVSYLYALRLLDLYPDADRDIVIAAIILHDIGWYAIDSADLLTKAFDGPDFLTSDIRYLHETEGVKLARPLLADLGYDKQFIEKVCTIIDGHDTRKFALCLEDELVRDADKLWRFHPVGVAIACDWFKQTPIQYAERLILDVIPQLHMAGSMKMAERDINESQEMFLIGIL